MATARRAETLNSLHAALNLPLDVTQQECLTGAVEYTLQRLGRIDVLLNNAGYALPGTFEEISDEQVQKLFDVNVFGSLRTIRAVLAHVRHQRAGRIVNMSSISGKLVVPANGKYLATKFALEAPSDALRLQLAPFSIKVVLTGPGSINTHFADTAQSHAQEIFSNPHSPYRTLYQQSRRVTAEMRR